jgi:hypothetical protein
LSITHSWVLFAFVKRSGPLALVLFAFSLSVSSAQTNIPSGISVRFSQRMYDEQGYFHGFPVKGFFAWAGMYSLRNSHVTWSPHPNLSGRFSDDPVQLTVGYSGITVSTSYDAVISKGSLSSSLEGEELWFDINMEASRSGTFTTYNYGGPPPNEMWDDYPSAYAMSKCQLEIMSDAPFRYEANQPLLDGAMQIVNTVHQTWEYAPPPEGGEWEWRAIDEYIGNAKAGTYYVDLEVNTQISPTEYDYVQPVTNSLNAQFKLTKLSVDPPKIASFKKEPNNFTLNWNDAWDRAVQIQRNSSLTSTNWETIGNGAIGQKSFVDTNAPTDNAFYRLVW